MTTSTSSQETGGQSAAGVMVFLFQGGRTTVVCVFFCCLGGLGVWCEGWWGRWCWQHMAALVWWSSIGKHICVWKYFHWVDTTIGIQQLSTLILSHRFLGQEHEFSMLWVIVLKHQNPNLTQLNTTSWCYSRKLVIGVIGSFWPSRFWVGYFPGSPGLNFVGNILDMFTEIMKCGWKLGWNKLGHWKSINTKMVRVHFDPPLYRLPHTFKRLPKQTKKRGNNKNVRKK